MRKESWSLLSDTIPIRSALPRAAKAELRACRDMSGAVGCTGRALRHSGGKHPNPACKREEFKYGRIYSDLERHGGSRCGARARK